MGQSEIFELLKNKRLSGDESFFSKRDVIRMLEDKNINSTCAQLHLKKLAWWGYLEIHFEGKEGKERLYRLKKDYL